MGLVSELRLKINVREGDKILEVNTERVAENGGASEYYTGWYIETLVGVNDRAVIVIRKDDTNKVDYNGFIDVLKALRIAAEEFLASHVKAVEELKKKG